MLSGPVIGDASEAIIAASPDFRGAWERFKASDRFGPDEPYNHLGELAQHLVDAMKLGKVDGFAPVFAEVENQLVKASPEARDLIIVGFLEDLQNISENQGVPKTAWTPWLGPKTAEAWKVLDDMWQGRLSPDDFNSFVSGKGE
jgi:hypothetical protein